MKKRKLLIFLVVCIFLWAFLYFENNYITTTKISVESPKLPDVFDGYKIVHLSDLHNKEFGKEQKNLVKKILDIQPDLIVLTGDLIDSRRFNAEISLELIRQIVKIAPTYFVTGNHEWRSGKFEILEKALIENGVHVLRNNYQRISKGEEAIYIIGIDDPVSNQAIQEKTKVVESEIKEATAGIAENKEFKILLAHRPEMFPLYSEYGFDLVFSGHAHGGQVRLPFLGGLVAPNQGLFPEFTAGEYKEGSSTMIVSRGLGNSIFPQRLFNHPEIVVLTLLKEK